MKLARFTKPAGSVVRASLVAWPYPRVMVASTLKLLGAAIDAVRVFEPAVPVSLTPLPVKLATPFTASMDVVPPSATEVAPLAVRVTVELTSTVLLSASWMVTTGWVAQAVSLARLLATAKLRWSTAPYVKVNCWVGAVRPPPVLRKVRVLRPTKPFLPRPEKVATPFTART